MEIGNFGFGDSGGGGGTIGGGGTLNYIAKFTPDGSTINNSLLFDNGTSVGLGTNTPDASALLDLSSTTQGLASPRMTTLQRDAIVAPVVSLLIYNTSSSFFNYWDGVAWIQMDTSTGGDVSGSGTTNYAVKWTDGTNSVIGDGTWAFSGNDYYPVTTGSNIGDATHRIGTIFMASVFDYANNLTFYNGTSTTMTLTTGGQLGIGITPTATLHITGSGSTSATSALKVENSLGRNLLSLRDDNVSSIGDFNYTSFFQVRGVGGDVNIQSDTNLLFFEIKPAAVNSLMSFSKGSSGTDVFATVDSSRGNWVFSNLSTSFNIQDTTTKIKIIGVDNTLANYALKADNSLGNPLFYVRNDGNTNINGRVGIGAVSSDESLFITNTNGDNARIRIVNQLAGGAFSQYSNATTGLAGYYNGVTASYGFLGTYGAIDLRITTNGVQHSIIKSNGDWGINTLLPTYKFEVQGTFLAQQSVDSYIFSNGSQAQMRINADNTVNVNRDNSGITEMIGYNNVSMRTPSASISVNNTSINFAQNDFINFKRTDNYFYGYWDTTNYRLKIGNLGFSPTLPSATLHLQGTDNTLANYAFKADNSLGNPLLYVANNGSVGINGGIDPLYTLTIGSKATGALRMYNSIFANMLTVTDASLYNFSGATRIGIGAVATSNNTMFLEAFDALTTSYSLNIASVGSVSTIFSVRNDGNVGIGTNTPATSALLDLTSTTGSLLVTRMTTTEKNALTAVNGMILYDTTLNKFQGYEAGAWVNLV